MRRILWMVALAALTLAPASALSKNGYIPMESNSNNVQAH